MLQSAGSSWGVSWALAVLGHVALLGSDYVEAAQHYHESLMASIDSGDVVWLGDGLVRLGVVAAAFGDTSRAVQLFGAAERLRERTNQPLQPYIRQQYEWALMRVQESLGEESLAQLWSVGRGWSLDTALAEAMTVTPTADEMSAPPSGDHSRGPRNLTAREMEVLRLIVAGNTDREIADALFLSRRTITTHTSHLFAKLGVTNRVQAATVAIRERLL